MAATHDEPEDADSTGTVVTEAAPSTARSPLDDPVRAALTGPHAWLAERRGNVLRYPADVAPFVSMPDEPTVGDWDDLAALAGEGGLVLLAGSSAHPPDAWPVVMDIAGVQMVDDSVTPAPAPEAERLEAADVPEMLALVDRTRPGPFAARTIELGTFLGIRREGRLIAMAGQRLRPPGWTEVSAVCTDPVGRGQGLATVLIRAVVADIRDRGEVAVLHAAAGNVSALRLYEALGFRVRRPISFLAARVPSSEPAP